MDQGTPLDLRSPLFSLLTSVLLLTFCSHSIFVSPCEKGFCWKRMLLTVQTVKLTEVCATLIKLINTVKLEKVIQLIDQQSLKNS